MTGKQLLSRRRKKLVKKLSIFKSLGPDKLLRSKMATTKGSEAAKKAWETRRKKEAAASKTPAEKAWDTRRKNEAAEEAANLEAIKILDDLAATRSPESAL